MKLSEMALGNFVKLLKCSQPSFFVARHWLGVSDGMVEHYRLINNVGLKGAVARLLPCLTSRMLSERVITSTNYKYSVFNFL